MSGHRPGRTQGSLMNRSDEVRPSVVAIAAACAGVTAQTRVESMQKVAVSVSAVTGAQLDTMKLDDSSSLVSLIPNLQVNGIVGEASPVFSLRGISMFDYSLNQSSPVAAYVDEVYEGNFAIFGVELYDLERVEVLRRPQGHRSVAC